MQILKLERARFINTFYLIFSLLTVSFLTAEAFPAAPPPSGGGLLVQVDAPSVFTPDPDAAAASKISGMDHRLFFRYALRFSGVKTADTEKYIEKYDSLSREFDDYLEKSVNIRGKAADDYSTGGDLLFFLHEKVLKRYSEMETRLDVLLDKGIFNCVSSGIIYYALALRSNLDVTGIRTSDHAFCAVVIPGKTVDVETTTKHGFDPGEKKEFTDSFGKTGFIYTPPANYRDRREISQQEFLALILQNRISELQHKANYYDTLPLAVDRYTLLGTSEAYDDMMKEFKNHAVELGNRKEYGKAVSFLSEAVSRYGSHPVISDAAGKLFYNQIVFFIEEGRTEKAEDFYRHYSSEPLISGRILEDSMRVINEKKLYYFVMEKNFTDSHKEILMYHANNLISIRERQEYLVFIYSREIQRLFSEDEWISALDLAAAAAEETENDSRILKLAGTVEFNLGIVYHNQFVAYYNSGAFEKARTVVEEGLSIVPDNKTLLSDLRLLEKKQ